MDLSLPFGLRWAASCCQYVTSLLVKSLKNSCIQPLSYTNDFSWVAQDEASVCQHFNLLGANLSWFSLQEAAHKA